MPAIEQFLASPILIDKALRSCANDGFSHFWHIGAARSIGWFGLDTVI